MIGYGQRSVIPIYGTFWEWEWDCLDWQSLLNGIAFFNFSKQSFRNGSAYFQDIPRMRVGMAEKAIC